MLVNVDERNEMSTKNNLLTEFLIKKLVLVGFGQ